MTDQFGDWTALLDQVMETAKDMAKILRTYYEALIEQGFTRGEALLLVESFSRQLTDSDGEHS